MTDTVVPASQPEPPKPAPPRRKSPRGSESPDEFIQMARKMVVDNYNQHRATDQPELPYDGVHIVWFTKTLGNWKAIVASSIIRGLLWEVTSNVYKHEVYIDVYKKLNNVKVIIPAPKGEPA